MLCHERQSHAVEGGYVLRYPFAIMDGDKKSVVRNAERFFAEATKETSRHANVETLLGKWNKEMFGIRVCSPEEVLEAMTLALGIGK